MRRAAAGALTVAVAAALVAAGEGPQPSPAHAAHRAPTGITIDDFSTGASQWQRDHATSSRRRVIAGEPVLTLKTGALTRPLPPGGTVSLDLRLSRGAVLDLDLGTAGTLRVRRIGSRLLADSTRVHRTAAPDGWYRLEVATRPARVALDGQVLRTREAGDRRHLRIGVTHGNADLRALVSARRADAGALLVQRLAWLHTRTPPGRYPIGTGLDSRLRFSNGWTRGFWAGSLWQAYDLTHSAMLERWARRATRDNFGAERANTHDLGFMYQLSSAQAYDHLCVPRAASADCTAFRKSALRAADSLLGLAATNSAVGTIPTTATTPCSSCTSVDESDTIIDSIMNVGLLSWASRVTGDARYRDLAALHAHILANTMVRSDGSTWASMHNRRSDGAFLHFHTHQGYSDDSTWARGQAWALRGFATTAVDLNDQGLLETAERTARYVLGRLPVPAVPRYDYDAPSSAPRDVSAAVITADGLLRLADACTSMAATCDPTPDSARAYAKRLLAASLAQLGTRPPLGFLGHQVYGLGGNASWDDDAELTFGINHALDALNDGA